MLFRSDDPAMHEVHQFFISRISDSVRYASKLCLRTLTGREILSSLGNQERALTLTPPPPSVRIASSGHDWYMTMGEAAASL